MLKLIGSMGSSVWTWVGLAFSILLLGRERAKRVAAELEKENEKREKEAYVDRLDKLYKQTEIVTDLDEHRAMRDAASKRRLIETIHMTEMLSEETDNDVALNELDKLLNKDADTDKN